MSRQRRPRSCSNILQDRSVVHRVLYLMRCNSPSRRNCLADGDLLLGAEVILALATVALASFTAVLWRATKRLAEIEERRDSDLVRSRKLGRVTLKLDLAE